MNFSRKKLLLIFCLFGISTLITLIYTICFIAQIFENNEGRYIVNIVIMFYSLICSIVFLILGIRFKPYKLCVSNRSQFLDFVCSFFPLYFALVAWDLFSIIFVFSPILSFLIFIGLLFVILFIGMFTRVFILRKRHEKFIVFKKDKAKSIDYENGLKQVSKEERVSLDVFDFDDANLLIKMRDKKDFLQYNDAKRYFFVKSLILDYLKQN